LSIKDPIIEVSGLTYGDRIHNYAGSLIVTDYINRIEAEAVFNPKSSEGYLKSVKSRLWGSSKPKVLTDIVKISVF